MPGADRDCRTIHPCEYLKDHNCGDRSVYLPLNVGFSDGQIANGFEVCSYLAFDPRQIPSSQQFSVFRSLSKIVLDLVFSKCWQPLASVFPTESWWWLTAECRWVPWAGAPGDRVQDRLLVLVTLLSGASESRGSAPSVPLEINPDQAGSGYFLVAWRRCSSYGSFCPEVKKLVPELTAALWTWAVTPACRSWAFLSLSLVGLQLDLECLD